MRHCGKMTDIQYFDNSILIYQISILRLYSLLYSFKFSLGSRLPKWSSAQKVYELCTKDNHTEVMFSLFQTHAFFLTYNPIAPDNIHMDSLFLHPVAVINVCMGVFLAVPSVTFNRFMNTANQDKRQNLCLENTTFTVNEINWYI